MNSLKWKDTKLIFSSVAFLCTKNELSEIEIKKAIPSTSISKKKKKKKRGSSHRGTVVNESD